MAIKLQHLVGQKYDNLLVATGESGPFAKEGKLVAQRLSAYRDEYYAIRTALSHGVARPAVYTDGKWVLIIRCLSIRSGTREDGVFMVEQDEAERLAERLRLDGQKLSCAFGQLRKEVSADEAA